MIFLKKGKGVLLCVNLMLEPKSVTLSVGTDTLPVHL